MEANGAAARSGLVLVGDQLVAVAGTSVLGLPIGDVMEQLGRAEGSEVALTFFRDTREQLQSVVLAGSSGPATSTITLRQPGQRDREIVVPYSCMART